MKRRVSILGSTGSIGTNTLRVIREHSDFFQVVSLSAGTSIDILLKQIEEFKPRYVSVATDEVATLLRAKIPNDVDCVVWSGSEGHRQCLELAKPQVVMSAMMGTHGLEASLQAILQNVEILGVANKEILVMAGDFINAALEESRTKMIPVDSEHSAIFQALLGNKISSLKKILLTGSGGPFRSRSKESFDSITREEALRHPNWVMGSKITIDSATMMNKGLEFIEALRLFRIHRDQIEVVIHPESIVHSLVEYVDGSVMAQLGNSDMRIPISLALGFPDRLPLSFERNFDLIKIGKLHFEAPDLDKFRCLKLAMNFDRYGAQGATVLNASNEVAVDLFLKDQIRFVEIAEWVEAALENFRSRVAYDLNSVIELDMEVKAWVASGALGKGLIASRRGA